MTVEELSNKILDEGSDEVRTDSEHVDSNHSVPSEHIDSNQNGSDDEFDSLTNGDGQTTDNSDSLTHYGVLGMKWGVRKDREKKPYEPKKKDRRYEGESDQDYQNRMAREERERSSKASERSKVKSEKRAAKERAQTQKRMLKSQERIKQMEIKAQQKNKELEIAERKRQEARSDKLAKEAEAKRRKEERKANREKTKSKPVNVRSLTDRELNDAIQRLRNEEQYKQLRVNNMALPKKTIVKAATIGGGILLAVGTAVAKQQLTAVGNMKAEEFLKKKGIEVPKGGNKGMSEDDFLKMFNKLKEGGKIT